MGDLVYLIKIHKLDFVNFIHGLIHVQSNLKGSKSAA